MSEGEIAAQASSPVDEVVPANVPLPEDPPEPAEKEKEKEKEVEGEKEKEKEGEKEKVKEKVEEKEKEKEVKKSLKDLPADVKRHMVGFITRPSDLKNLCLACKDLREMATPNLYHKMSLELGGQRDMNLISMLNHKNPGIRYVRKLYVNVDDVHEPASPNSGNAVTPVPSGVVARFAQVTVRMILEFLPEDVLETFFWGSWDPLSTESFMLLLRRQRNLTKIDITPTDKPMHPELEKNPKILEKLTKVKSLTMHIELEDQLKIAQMFLSNFKNVRSLKMRPSSKTNNSDFVLNDLHDKSTRPGRLTSTVFSHMVPFEKCTPITLRKLCLDNVEVRYASESWFRFIKFEGLEDLKVFDCAGADAFWSQLSRNQHRPRGLKHIRWMDEKSHQPHAMDAFEEFLWGFSGLESVHLWLCNMEALPKVGALTQHKSTLKTLAVWCKGDDGEHCYSTEDFGRLCEECGVLEQLSIQFPETSAETSRLNDKFESYMQSMLKLHNLIALVIRRWPHSASNFESDATAANRRLRLYENHLQRLAQKLFDLSDGDARAKGYGLGGSRSRLSVLAWGHPGNSLRQGTSDYFKLRQVPFVRGWKVGPFGEKKMLAVQVPYRMVKYVDPRIDVLRVGIGSWRDQDDGLVQTN